MAIERTWTAVSQPFSSDGTSQGTFKVANADGFYVKQNISLKSNTQPALFVQIKRVDSDGTIYVGDPTQSISNRTPIPQFLVSDAATATAADQSIPYQKPDDIFNAVYEREPTKALRVEPVDRLGVPYDKNNPLPIAFDGTIAIGDVSVVEGGNTMVVNADGSINVTDAVTHADLTQIDTDLVAFKNANHVDLSAIDTELTTFAGQNHTDLTKVDTDLNTFASQNHTDLTTVDTDIKAIEGPVAPGTVAQKSALMGGQFNAVLPKLASGQQSAVQLDPRGRVYANSRQPPGTLDVFGTTTVAPRQLQIDIQFFNGILSSLINLTTSGGANGSMGQGNAVFSTGTGATAQCLGVSTETVAYASGCEIFAHFTAAFTTPTSSASYQRIGLYNPSNGFYLGYNGTSFVVAVRNNSTDVTVPQASWNVDTLNGSVGSAYTRNGVPEAINFTNANVWRIRFGWLGSAPIYFEILSPDGEWVTFHKVQQPNTSPNPSVSNPNLPVTVDVSKTASDATNLSIYTACWGAGITFATNVLEDPQTYEYINVDHRNELRTTTSTMLIGSVQTGTILDTNMWSTSNTGSGSNSLSNGLDVLSTGTTANSSSKLNSLFRARFIPGTVNAFYAGVRIPDTGIVNNIRRWGAYDSNNGVYFQLNGSIPGIGVRSSGVDTIVTNFNGPYQYVLDTNFHVYEIQYTSGNAYFYQDSHLIHSFVSPTTALTATPHLFLGFETTNSNGATTNAQLYIRGSSIMRYGEANARPRYFHPVYTSRVQAQASSTSVASTDLSLTINPTKAGNLLVISATAIKDTLTVTDNLGQTYSTAVNSTDGTNNLYIFYVQNTLANVTSITITSPTSTAMTLLMGEYSNITATGAFDKSSSLYNAGVTTFTSGLTPTTTQSNELLIGAATDVQHNNTTYLAGTNWTSVLTKGDTGSGGNLTGFLEEQYVTSTGTYAATGTASQSANILAAIATFKIANNALSNGFTVLNSPTTIAIGAGTLRKVIINTPGTSGSTVTFYDSTTNSGNIIAILALSGNVNQISYDLDFSNGLTMVVNSPTADFTVVYD